MSDRRDKPAHDMTEFSLGQIGVHTGHWANSLGYQLHQQQQANEAAALKAREAALQDAPTARPYKPFHLTRVVEASIPPAVPRSLGLVTALTALAIGFQGGFLLPVAPNGAADWPAVTLAAMVAVLAYAIGASVLTLTIRLLDMGVRLLLDLVKLALVLGAIVLAIGWLAT